ncbi:MAG: MATE family efflux transporter [Eubacteriales bacterium]|nr:MATE family efflux transporter [Eubacteriales bacterium]
MNNAETFEQKPTFTVMVKKTLFFTLPIIFSSILQLIYNSADLVIVGRFGGDNALASVGATISLFNLITALFLGLSVGVNICASFYIGSDDRKNASEVSHTAVCTALLLGVTISVFGFFLSPVLLNILRTPKDGGVFDGAVLYMRICFIGMPASLMYNYCSALLKSLGDTRRPFIYLMISGMVNIALNLMFVLVLDMTVDGVAYATVLSQTLSAVLTLIRLFRYDSYFKLSPRKMKLSYHKFIRIIALGLPAGIQSAAFSLSNVFFQSAVNSFGIYAISGMSAVNTFDDITYQSVYAFQDAAVTFTSNSMGAKKYSSIKTIFLATSLLSVLTGLLAGWTILIFDEPLLSLFIPDSPKAMSYALERIWTTMPLYFIPGIMCTSSATLRGMGKSIQPSIITVVGVCVTRIVWLYTVFAAKPSIRTLFLSYPVTWTIVTVSFCFLLFRYLRKMKKKGIIDGIPIKQN